MALLMGQERFIGLSYIPEGSTNDVYTVDDPAAINVEYKVVGQGCRLTGGRLAHELQCVEGVVCLDTNTSTTVLLSVEVLGYDDVNDDGYMDVKVRRSLPGSACPTEELVLSRKQPGGRFYVVEVVDRWIRE